MVSENTKREVKLFIASAAILVSVLTLVGVVVVIRYSFYPANVIMVAGMIMLGSTMVYHGLDTVIGIVGVARTDDTYYDILRDFPPTELRVYGNIEDRIIKRLLVNNEETIHLKALQKILDERKTS